MSRHRCCLLAILRHHFIAVQFVLLCVLPSDVAVLLALRQDILQAQPVLVVLVVVLDLGFGLRGDELAKERPVLAVHLKVLHEQVLLPSRPLLHRPPPLITSVVVIKPKGPGQP